MSASKHLSAKNDASLNLIKLHSAKLKGGILKIQYILTM